MNRQAQYKMFPCQLDKEVPVAVAEASVEESPNVSPTRRSRALGISVTSLWRILRNDLGLHPYKIKLKQELKQLDHLKRHMFVN